MRDITDLVQGYKQFLEEEYPKQADLYRTLAEKGQTPKTMVIACCDSRADPGVIFNAGPGEIFVVRNVANLVPPYEPHGDYHGTSAALEFAVNGLNVETILVMGHARCGGIHAFVCLALHKVYDVHQLLVLSELHGNPIAVLLFEPRPLDHFFPEVPEVVPFELVQGLLRLRSI